MRKGITIDERFHADVFDFEHPLPEEIRRRSPFGGSFREENAKAIVLAVNAASVGLARIVETDNFGGDYPDESFLLYPMPKEMAERIAQAINDAHPEDSRRFWKVVGVDYELQPGFEP